MILEVVLFLVSAVLLHFIVCRLSEPTNLPPGPRALPLLGNLLDVIDSMPFAHEAFCKLQKTYGDIFTLYLQGRRIIVINSASSAREALLTRKDDFAGRPYVFTGDYVTRGSQDIVFGDYSERLKLLRKIGTKALRLFNPQIERLVQVEMKELIARMKAYGTNTINIKNDVQLSVMNIVCALIFGQRYDIDDPEFLKCVYFTDTACKVAESTGVLSILPWLIHFPIKPARDIKNCCTVKDEILNRKYREHFETFDENVTRDLTDALIKVKLEEENVDGNDVINEDHVIMTIQDVFIAGNETSTTTILWTLIHLMCHPQIQAKLHAEIDDVLGFDRMPEIKDRERLPYVEAVLAETARLSSVVPLSVPHKSTRHTTLDKYDIPKDTTVLLNLWAIHHDERQWDDPMEFRPERFLDSEGRMRDVSKLSYMPFSAGRRVCLGETMARQEMFLLVTGMLQEFEFSSPPDAAIQQLQGTHGIVRMPEDFQMHYAFKGLAEKYGSLFTIYLNGQRVVVINSVAAAREALMAKKDDFSGRPYSFSGFIFSRGFKGIGFTDFNPTLMMQRKIAHAAIRMYGPKLEEKVIMEADELIKRMKDYNSQPFSPRTDFSLTVMNIICAIVFGKRYEIHDPEFLDLSENNHRATWVVGGLLDVFPWLIHFPVKHTKAMNDLIRSRDNMLGKRYKEHIETFQADREVRDLTDALIKAKREEGRESEKVITEDHVIMTMQDIFIAGHETTTTTHLWLVVFLSRHPEIQEKVHAELDEVVGRARAPDSRDRDKLHFLQATIAETLRFSSLVPLMLPHKTTRDTHLGGYFIPNNTMVLINNHAMSHDKGYWTRPEEFDPSRFLDDEGQFTTANLAFLPFGAGRRVCIGESIAKKTVMMMMTVHVAMVVMMMMTVVMVVNDDDDCACGDGGDDDDDCGDGRQ
ncbi:hypothetical protein QZH41_001171 [Actinostola sp. cb2023]|nr:hypothetical protein QZH41_001171 [Actinostola sp. cb2023]